MLVKRFFSNLILAAATLLGNAAVSAGEATEKALQEAVNNSLRKPANVQRDRYRHPVETLAFFEVEPGSQVVEIWPGRGWYTEVLAPYLARQGKLYAAHFPDLPEIPFFKTVRDNYMAMLEANAEQYGKPVVTVFFPPGQAMAGPDGAADHVLTFRNVHNWMKRGYEAEAFKTFYQLLKPGGILGVVEHRAKPDTSLEQMIKSGYVTEAYVKEMAAQAGFEFVAASDINANARDNRDHPKGVWTLPPSLRLGDQDREHYLKIGESDRMTLKFRKP